MSHQVKTFTKRELSGGGSFEAGLAAMLDGFGGDLLAVSVGEQTVTVVSRQSTSKQKDK